MARFVKAGYVATVSEAMELISRSTERISSLKLFDIVNVVG